MYERINHGISNDSVVQIVSKEHSEHLGHNCPIA